MRKRLKVTIIVGAAALAVTAVAVGSFAAIAAYNTGRDTAAASVGSSGPTSASSLTAAVAKTDAKYAPATTAAWYADPIWRQPVFVTGRALHDRQNIQGLHAMLAHANKFDVGSYFYNRGEADTLQQWLASPKQIRAYDDALAKASESLVRMQACSGNDTTAMMGARIYATNQDFAKQAVAEAKKFCTLAK